MTLTRTAKHLTAWVLGCIAIWSALIALVSCHGCASTPPPHGIANLYVVNAETGLYRGAEPDAEGYQYLHDFWGVSNVVKLNTDAESTDAPAVALGMTVRRFPIDAKTQVFGPVDEKLIRAAVEAMKIPGTFVHCGSDKRTRSKLDADMNTVGGQDRTGILVACYRVWVQGWTKEKAFAEAKSIGFHSLWEKALYDFFWEKA